MDLCAGLCVSTGPSSLVAMHSSNHLEQARFLHREGRLAEAGERYERHLAQRPRDIEALLGSGVLATQRGDFAGAVRWLEIAVSIDPGRAAAHCYLGLALHRLGRSEEALDSFDRALSLQPDLPEAHLNRGVALQTLERHADALASYEQALRAKPAYAKAHNNRGNALRSLGRHAEALACYATALTLIPSYAEAHYNRGTVLAALGRWEEARQAYEGAIALQPDFPQAHLNLGVALHELRRLAAAQASFSRALDLSPEFAAAYLNRGNVARDAMDDAAALADYERAIELEPDAAPAYANRGHVFQERGDYAAAVASYEQALARDSTFKYLSGKRIHAKLQICDWDGLSADLAMLAAEITGGEAVADPATLLALTDSTELQRRAAEIWVREECPPDDTLGPFAPRRARRRIRLGYFSPDFREHPVSILTAGLYEMHDRSRFEVFAFSFGPDTGDAMRRRLECAFEHFIDVRAMADAEIAALARQLEIDIAVDLAGFTQDCRTRIFALRAAPLQLSYLGYLGTMGAPYIDYLIADETLVPAHDQEQYTEQILYLPSYQANDSRRPIAARRYSRAEFGLPATGFVYCCFNASYKIAPEVFAAWMRILARVDGSVLFLYAESAAARDNLRREASRRGMAPERLVFGERLPAEENLARYRAADLFLDTLPQNAGTTASDALWAGLPLLTRRGRTFAGRVAASLLEAAGLPELIVSTVDEYEATAIALARGPERLAEFRLRLVGAHTQSRLFDTGAHTRALEAAFEEIHTRQLAGLPPKHRSARAERP